MNVLVFGASGMVGQGVLLECFRDPGVERVVSAGRSPSGRSHPKLRDLVVPDLTRLAGVESELTGFDLCCFCLGTSAAGMTEAGYSAVTYDLTLGVASTLARLNPGMTFIYVSGVGTDSSEHGRIMWARVKGRTENALLRLPFRAAFNFRPGLIQPLDGIRSRTPAYRWFYIVAGPILPLMRRLFPASITSTAILARAMLLVARNGYPTPVLEMADIELTGRGMRDAGCGMRDAGCGN